MNKYSDLFLDEAKVSTSKYSDLFLDEAKVKPELLSLEDLGPIRQALGAPAEVEPSWFEREKMKLEDILHPKEAITPSPAIPELLDVIQQPIVAEPISTAVGKEQIRGFAPELLAGEKPTLQPSILRAPEETEAGLIESNLHSLLELFKFPVTAGLEVEKTLVPLGKEGIAKYIPKPTTETGKWFGQMAKGIGLAPVELASTLLQLAQVDQPEIYVIGRGWMSREKIAGEMVRSLPEQAIKVLIGRGMLGVGGKIARGAKVGWKRGQIGLAERLKTVKGPEPGLLPERLKRIEEWEIPEPRIKPVEAKAVPPSPRAEPPDIFPGLREKVVPEIAPGPPEGIMETIFGLEKPKKKLKAEGIGEDLKATLTELVEAKLGKKKPPAPVAGKGGISPKREAELKTFADRSLEQVELGKAAGRTFVWPETWERGTAQPRVTADASTYPQWYRDMTRDYSIKKSQAIKALKEIKEKGMEADGRQYVENVKASILEAMTEERSRYAQEILKERAKRGVLTDVEKELYGFFEKKGKEFKAEPPVETKPLPKVEGGEPGIIGLNKAEQNVIRKLIDRPELTPAKRKSFEMSAAEAKQGKFDENALSIADEVLKSKRPISDVEHAGMTLKAAQLANEYNVSVKTTSDLVKKGETRAAEVERMRTGTIGDQLDKLTEGADQAGTRAGRALSIRRMLVDMETYDIAHVMQRVRASKGAKLTNAESAKFERLTAENSSLEAALKEIEVKYEKVLADKEMKIAEGVATREVHRAKIKQRTATAIEKVRADRENIKKQLAEMGFRVNDITGVTTEGAYLVGRLATTYIKEGALTLSEVVQKVLMDLPQLTEHDVYRSLAMKNHKAQQRAKIEVNRRVAQLKTQARLLVDIEKAEKGIFEPKRTKAEQLPEIKRLQRKLRELRNGAYRTEIEAARLEQAITKINELQDMLANHHRAVRKGKALDPPELAAMKEKIKELRSQMRVQDEIARLDEQLRTGEFEVKERPVPKQLPPEIERAQIELKRKRQEIRAAINDMAPMTARKIGIEAINTARTLKATADMSGVLRQGLILSVRRPIKASKNFAKSVRATFSKYTAEQIDHAMRSSDSYYLCEKAKLELTELGGKPLLREEMFMAQVIEKFPVVGEIVKASNRHMTTFLNLMRKDAFDQFLKKYPNATHAELTAWADAVNVFSGRGNLGRFKAIANELSLLIFAPRFAVSRAQTPYMFFKYFKMPRVRAEIAKDLTATAGLGATILTLAHLSGADVGLDPREADYGKIRVGDTRIDIWGGCQQPIRLVTRIGLAVTDRAGLTGKELSKREKQLDPVELIGRFTAFKLAPSVTIPRELITGKTAVGEPVTPTETAIRAVTPMVYESIYEAYELEGKKRAALVGGLEFFGVSVGTYKDSESRTRRDMRKMIKEGNTLGAFNKMFEWNMENPDNRISESWYSKLLLEVAE